MAELKELKLSATLSTCSKAWTSKAFDIDNYITQGWERGTVIKFPAGLIQLPNITNSNFKNYGEIEEIDFFYNSTNEATIGLFDYKSRADMEDFTSIGAAHFRENNEYVDPFATIHLLSGKQVVNFSANANSSTFYALRDRIESGKTSFLVANDFQRTNTMYNSANYIESLSDILFVIYYRLRDVSIDVRCMYNGRTDYKSMHDTTCTLTVSDARMNNTVILDAKNPWNPYNFKVRSDETIVRFTTKTNNDKIKNKTIHFDDEQGKCFSKDSIIYVDLCDIFTITLDYDDERQEITELDQIFNERMDPELFPKPSKSPTEEPARKIILNYNDGIREPKIEDVWAERSYNFKYWGIPTGADRTKDIEMGFMPNSNYTLKAFYDSEVYIADFPLDDVSRDGYIFRGWRKKTLAPGEKEKLYFHESYHFELDEDSVELVAVWEPDGVVSIDSVNDFTNYKVYIDDGNEWTDYIAYVDDGESWNILNIK